MQEPSFQAEINHAIEVLKKGGTILYPTDTVWGLGCDARNKDAVNKLFKLKQRVEYKSMVVLVSDESMISRYVKDVPPVVWELIEAATEPLTIVYPNGRMLANGLIAADGSIGIRLVKDDFCQKLIRKFGKPIVSTSANLSGEMTPSSFNDIDSDIVKHTDYIVKLKQEQTINAKPSTIIKVWTNGEVKILRK